MRTENVSKYIHYFKDEKLIRFQRLSGTGTKTLQIDFFNEIQYKKKNPSWFLLMIESLIGRPNPSKMKIEKLDA